MLELRLGRGELVPDPHLGDHAVGADIRLHGELRDPDRFGLDQSLAGGGVLLLLMKMGGVREEGVVVRSIF